VVANKIDAAENRVVTREEGEECAKSINAKYFEISVKDNTNFDQMMTSVIDECVPCIQPIANEPSPPPVH